MSNHTVHNIRLNLPATDYQEARRHQSAAKHWVQEAFSTQLSAYLDNLYTHDELVYIDKIEFNISELPWNLADNKWQEHFSELIQISAAADNTIELVIEHWFYYLQHGCFGKNALLNNIAAIEAYLLKHESELNQFTILPEAISLPVLQRLINQHGRELVIKLLKNFLNPGNDYIASVYESLKTNCQKQPGKTHHVFSMIMVAERDNDIQLKTRWINLLVNDPKQLLSADLPYQKSAMNQKTKQSQQEPQKQNHINCPNAGLVLLLPYLHSLFTNCGFVNGNEFISTDSRQLALLALHFLASGEPIAAEENLVLPKIICGITLDEYTGTEQSLSPDIQTEANDLLHSVIEHWKTLRNTSPASFRETFLRRPGQLMQKDENYLLQVEDSGVDILLNSIPWGFRNYRLPWMRFNLITEWY